MPVYVYGDVTVDNYEYFDRFSNTFKKLFESPDPKGNPPEMSGEASHRIVARALGGAFLLARFTSIAISLWRSKNPVQHPNHRSQWFKGLDELQPWAADSERLHDQNSDITKRPDKYADLLTLYYRLKRSLNDRCYRVEPGGMEGYTLPAVYRQDNYLNSQALYRSGAKEAHAISVDGESSSTNCVMLFNDGGLRYKSDPDDWLVEEIKRLRNRGSVWAVVKSRDPVVKKNGLESAPFVRYLTRLRSAGMQEQTIACLNADDLRALGIEISHSLSWEKSLKELVSNLEAGEILPGNLPNHLVVTFDYDAVTYLKTSQQNEKIKVEKGTLIFSKNFSEGEFAAQVDGKMPGAQSLFVSVFSALLYEWDKARDAAAESPSEPPFETLIGYALLAKRRMLECGFAPLDADGIIKLEPNEYDSDGNVISHWLIPKLYYLEAMFALQQLPAKGEDRVKSVPIADKETERERPSFRRPLTGGDEKVRSKQLEDDLSRHDLVIFPFESGFFEGNTEIFQYLGTRENYNDNKFVDYVLHDDPKLPVCTFGKLRTISREEIEGLRTIRRLAKQYLENSQPSEKPIGIAVFGPPGTGKSFAVKTVFETLPKVCKNLTEDAFLECNLSGLERPEDVAEVFQLARDKRLRGKVPVLFFDEFDCSVHGEPYFWLKHFLAPLQDGEFTTGHTKRPIGKSIFVFAGGTKRSYAEFEAEVEPAFAARQAPEATKAERTNGAAESDKKPVMAENGKKPVMKGRDFLSRLQAHLDIMPLDPDEKELEGLAESESHKLMLPYTMRKAILLRGVLLQWAPQIFDSRKKMASMDREMVLQFLTKWRYKHGIRSIEAIIRMSALGDEVRFNRSCLPPEAQLFMHIDKPLPPAAAK
jgi:hypothetical protein